MRQVFDLIMPRFLFLRCKTNSDREYTSVNVSNNCMFAKPCLLPYGV